MGQDVTVDTMTGPSKIEYSKYSKAITKEIQYLKVITKEIQYLKVLYNKKL